MIEASMSIDIVPDSSPQISVLSKWQQFQWHPSGQNERALDHRAYSLSDRWPCWPRLLSLQTVNGRSVEISSSQRQNHWRIGLHWQILPSTTAHNIIFHDLRLLVVVFWFALLYRGMRIRLSGTDLGWVIVSLVQSNTEQQNLEIQIQAATSFCIVTRTKYSIEKWQRGRPTPSSARPANNFSRAPFAAFHNKTTWSLVQLFPIP